MNAWIRFVAISSSVGGIGFGCAIGITCADTLASQRGENPGRPLRPVDFGAPLGEAIPVPPTAPLELRLELLGREAGARLETSSGGHHTPPAPGRSGSLVA